MKIITLVENTTAHEELACEHGLSLYVERNGKKILIDTGAGDKFADNAKKMQIDLKQLDAVVISHNHYDHTGGLAALFKINPTVKVFIKTAAKGDFYKRIGIIKAYIGTTKYFFRRFSDRFIFFQNFSEIDEGFYLASTEVINDEYKSNDKSLLEKAGKKYIHDRFNHECFCVIHEPDGIVIISSCSHQGIVNIINTVKYRWSGVPIISVIGGFHMKGNKKNTLNCTYDYVDTIAMQLNKMKLGTIYTCHCTGEKAYEIMRETLGEKIQYLRTGEELEL